MRWVIGLVPALMLLPAAAQPVPAPAEETIDIYQVTPAELLGGDARSLVTEAHQAYREARYEDAARAFIQALQRTPGDANSTYNLACCYGLLGAEEQAAAFLEAAWRGGFRDLEHIQQDSDFDKVRQGERFAALMEKLATAHGEAQDARGILLPLAAPQMATVRVIPPEETDPWARHPLVIGLHGHGDNSENFARLFRGRGLEQPFIFCVPEGPYAYPVGSRVGYSWGVEVEGATAAMQLRGGRLSREYVLACIDAVRQHYRVDAQRIYVLGFSQGAGQAVSVGLHHPGLFRGIIAIGGWVDRAEYTRKELHRASREALVLLCHSPEDRVVPFSACESGAAFLEAHEVPYAVRAYPGGHRLPRELLQSILTWIEEPGPVAPALEEAHPAGTTPVPEAEPAEED